MDSGRHASVERPSFLKSIFNIILMLAFVLGMSWFLRTYIFQAYEIPSGSMEPTIMTGDLVFAEKITYLFEDPVVGDIVTFQDPDIPGRVLIKRIIATEGQTVTIDESGIVYVDGVALDESYTDGDPTYPLENSDITYPYTVPEDSIWVMGDNRLNSQDSRYFGAVSLTTVTAKGVWTYWPIDSFGPLE